MNLEQYIFNRNYQHSKNSPIYNLNISIFVAIDSLDQLSFINNNILQHNGLEAFILLIDNIHSIPTTQIEKYPIGNWIIGSCKPFFFTNYFMQDIKKEITRKYLLLIDNIDYLSTLTIEDLTALFSAISQYNDHFISYNRKGAKALLISQKDIDRITSYSFSTYSLNNDSIELVKRFLELSGLREISIHSEKYNHDEPGLNNKLDSNITKELQCVKYQYYERKAATNWCSKATTIDILFDYRNKKQTFNRLISYLNKFETYELFNSQFYKNKYQKIVLVQSYNENDNVIDFLNNIGLFFDGIIMLDDESTDNTYSMASHEKLLLKVRKKREAFLDIDNRNILLTLSSFYPVEWLCFMDFDERINPEFADFSFLNNNQIDTIAFNIVHLWDDSKLFNASFPGTYKGIEKVFRMFRNIGYSQIKSNKRFHFAVTPYFGRQSFDSGILIMHFGFLHKSNRRQKYEFYTKNDPLATQNQYNFLINDSLSLKEIDSLSIDDLLNIDYSNYSKK